MAKLKVKNYWALIALVILANVLIFSFFSNRLQGFVTNYTIEQLEAKNGL